MFLTGLDLAWTKATKPSQITIEALHQTAPEATELVLHCKNLPKQVELNSDITHRISSQYLNKIFCSENNLSIFYYGKNLIFTIVQIKSTLEEQLEKLNLKNASFFKISAKTRIVFRNVHKEVKKIHAPCPVYGLNDIKSQITDYIKFFRDCRDDKDCIRCVLLYGFHGTGKTSLALNISETTHLPKVIIRSEFIKMMVEAGQAEKYFSDTFEAAAKEKTLIILDDLDLLCPSRLSKPSEHEKRLTSCLIYILDNVIKNNVFIIATCVRPEDLDNSLRRYGRIDREIEIPIPTEETRANILADIIIPSNFTLSDFDHFAELTPGFVGSDLMLLAGMVHARYGTGMVLTNVIDTIKEIKPSGMRDVQIESPNINWSDIGGQKDLKLKLMQAITWPLTNPECFKRMGISPPKGVLMYGPPGCSKTMIAKALASESKVNFLSIKGPELFNKYVGESEKAIRDLFRRARQASPSIIFFDEIDAISGERGLSGGGNVQERVLAQLLTELDGVTELGAVTVVAATNRPDRIDKALLRPGRLDRIVYVSLPDEETRIEIIKIKTAKMPVELKHLDINSLARSTHGYSGAEVQAVCNEAAMLALEENMDAKTVDDKHFEKALKLVQPRTPNYLLDIYEKYASNSAQM